MDELALHFFPYPHVFKGNRRPGLSFDYPERCNTCDRQCEGAPQTELGLCSFGVNFLRVDEDLLINGVIVKDDARNTPARAKQLRLRVNQVSRKQLRATADRALQATGIMEDDLAEARAQVMSEYRESKEYQTEILDLLRPEIEKALGLASRSGFRLHGLVHKTVQIYGSGFEGKGITLNFGGESFQAMEGNYRAVSTIPHCLLDNALKYAPRDSSVYVNVVDLEDEIRFSVRSLGPKISDDESELIFDLFYLGRSARAGGTEGTGFGLALASNVVRAMGSRITVVQERSEVSNGNYWTTFSVQFPAIPDSTQRSGRRDATRSRERRS